jgi:integrase/recombinase XerD
LQEVGHDLDCPSYRGLSATSWSTEFPALEQIQRILAIPTKKTDARLVRHLTADEMQSILDAPDPTVRDGIRDRAMLHLCFDGGLRVSELVGLRAEDLLLQPQASILVHGKGRKERCLPLWKRTASALRAWLAVRGTSHAPELFLNARSTFMTRAGFEYILRKHVRAAAKQCPSLSAKRISPHVLRHTCALTILQVRLASSLGPVRRFNLAHPELLIP